MLRLAVGYPLQSGLVSTVVFLFSKKNVKHPNLATHPKPIKFALELFFLYGNLNKNRRHINGNDFAKAKRNRR
jgi:hypothetical protein